MRKGSEISACILLGISGHTLHKIREFPAEQEILYALPATLELQPYRKLIMLHNP